MTETCVCVCDGKCVDTPVRVQNCNPVAEQVRFKPDICCVRVRDVCRTRSLRRTNEQHSISYISSHIHTHTDVEQAPVLGSKSHIRGTVIINTLCVPM